MSENRDAIWIRLMRANDIPLGLSLCRFAGWNQLEDDWRRLLTLNPQNVFVAECGGVPCGTASVTCYDAKLAWIGMVLVHPDRRRHGVGGALIQHSLDFLHTARVECIKLDATEQGRRVYLKHAFEDERPIDRCLAAIQPGAFECHLPPIEETDWRDIGYLDLDVFGADRLPLLKHLARDGVTAVASSPDGIQGYGFARAGFNATYLGPVVATNNKCARDVVTSLLGKLPADRGVYWDVFPENVDALELAQSLGFHVERSLTRMRYGTLASVTNIDRVYGASGFETG
ncbi:MAG: hypothetical protein QG656_377 [Candidatus Hydrogenedentes bacterium]|nr:hypothetical protein [Candidatus Hydrogenedentota bacterium]